MLKYCAARAGSFLYYVPVIGLSYTNVLSFGAGEPRETKHRLNSHQINSILDFKQDNRAPLTNQCKMLVRLRSLTSRENNKIKTSAVCSHLHTKLFSSLFDNSLILTVLHQYKQREENLSNL